VVFVADDLAAWLAGLLADAGRKKLATLVLGSEQERALRSAATAAVQITAAEFRPGEEDQATQLAWVISQVFREPVPSAPLSVHDTVLEAIQAGIAGQLAALDDASLTGTGQSLSEVLEVPGTVLAEKLTGHLVREIIVRGARGGPLYPLASQLNHDVTYLQGQRLRDMVGRMTNDSGRLDAGDPLGGGPVRPDTEVRAELEVVLEADESRLGQVYRASQRGLDARAIAAELGVETSGFVWNYERIAKALLDGNLPSAPSVALIAAQRYRSILKFARLSPAARAYLETNLRELERRALEQVSMSLEQVPRSQSDSRGTILLSRSEQNLAGEGGVRAVTVLPINIGDVHGGRVETTAGALLNVVSNGVTNQYAFSWSTNLSALLCFEMLDKRRILQPTTREEPIPFAIGVETRDGEWKTEFESQSRPPYRNNFRSVLLKVDESDQVLARWELPGIAWVWQAKSPLQSGFDARTFGVIAEFLDESFVLQAFDLTADQKTKAIRHRLVALASAAPDPEKIASALSDNWGI
jgi:hypothetical protein